MSLIGSPEGRGHSVIIHQDVEFYSSILFPEDTLTHKIKKGRCVWVQLASGVIEVNKVPLFIGDGVAVIEEPCIEIAAIAKSEFLLFDLGQ